jgi:hypothetical protein
LLNDKNNSEAIVHFDRSLSYPENKELTAQANYWKAEALYRSGKYAESVKGYESFIYGLNAFNQKIFNRAIYNLGYASAVVVVFFVIIIALSLLLLYVRQKLKWNA